MFRNWMRNRLGLDSAPVSNPMSPMGGMKGGLIPQENPMFPMGGVRSAGAWLPQENPMSPIGFENRPRGGGESAPFDYQPMGQFTPQPSNTPPKEQKFGARSLHASSPFMW